MKGFKMSKIRATVKGIEQSKDNQFYTGNRMVDVGYQKAKTILKQKKEQLSSELNNHVIERENQKFYAEEARKNALNSKNKEEKTALENKAKNHEIKAKEADRPFKKSQIKHQEMEALEKETDKRVQNYKNHSALGKLNFNILSKTVDVIGDIIYFAKNKQSSSKQSKDDKLEFPNDKAVAEQKAARIQAVKEKFKGMGGPVEVEEYTRSDGTKVKAHTRGR